MGGLISRGHHTYALSPTTFLGLSFGYPIRPYFMDLNLSNSQIAQKLDLDRSMVQELTEQLCEGM